MKRIVILSTAIVAGLVAANSAVAFGGPRESVERPSFAQLDTDGDGKVSAAEMAAFPAAQAEARFKAADTDGDGKISKEEMAASVEAMKSSRNSQRIDTMITRLDTDKDGAISQEEMTAMTGRNRAADPGDRFITRFDTDKDGAISAEEYAEAEKYMQMNGGRGDRDKNGRGDRGGKDQRGDKGQRGDRAPFWRN